VKVQNNTIVNGKCDWNIWNGGTL